MSDGVSAVIASLNGKDKIDTHLPTVIRALDKSGCEYEVLVIDDGSTDGTVEFVRSRYPEVNVIGLAKRHGAEEARNIGFRKARFDHILCLDNDISLDPDFFHSILSYFDDPSVFAVTTRIMDMTGQVQLFGKANCSFSKGMFITKMLPSVDFPSVTLFASTAASIFDRNKALELGGFDPLFGSAHLMDMDLSYRAWKRGWRVIYEPRSASYHEVSGTRAKLFTGQQRRQLELRNKLIFTWKNLTDVPMLVRHALFLPPRLAFWGLSGKWWGIPAFLKALRFLPEVKRRKREQSGKLRISDREVRERVNGVGIS